MSRIPLLQPARDWSEWWSDTAVAVALVLLLMVLTGLSPAIPGAVGFGIQAGAALRLARSGGGGGGGGGDG